LGVLLLCLLLGEVAETKDISYGEHAKQKLDLCVPKDAKDFPTVLFIHGGAWREGDRRLYAALGRRFAEAGVGLAATSYRLSPEVKHPEHVKDVARAFAWVHANIAKHGGSAGRLYVMGHSAGGHLAALLALDATRLDELKVPRGAIKGVIPMSGIYLVTAVQADARGMMKIMADAFGSDREVCRGASPVAHVKDAACPFLVLTETDDTLKVRPSMMLLKAAVQRQGVKDFEFVDAEGRDHFTIISKMMAEGEDPYRRRVLDFVLK
jgi:acetyl esterase/lipase